MCKKEDNKCIQAKEPHIIAHFFVNVLFWLINKFEISLKKKR